MYLLGLFILLGGVLTLLLSVVFCFIRMEELMRESGYKMSMLNPLSPFKLYSDFARKMGRSHSVLKFFRAFSYIGIGLFVIGLIVLLIGKELSS